MEPESTIVYILPSYCIALKGLHILQSRVAWQIETVNTILSDYGCHDDTDAYSMDEKGLLDYCSGSAVPVDAALPCTHIYSLVYGQHPPVATNNRAMMVDALSGCSDKDWYRDKGRVRICIYPVIGTAPDSSYSELSVQEFCN